MEHNMITIEGLHWESLREVMNIDDERIPNDGIQRLFDFMDWTMMKVIEWAIK